MKTLVLLFATVLPLLSIGQYAQCWDSQKGTLAVEVHGDTVILKNDNANRNCFARYKMEISQSSDTITWLQSDTGMTAGCWCNFNLSVTIDSLRTGHYYLKAYYQKLEGGDTICYIGLTEFDILEQNNYELSKIIDQGQSDCFQVDINEWSQVKNDFALIYPNPVTNFICIKTADKSTKSILIFDIQNRIRFRTQSKEEIITIDMSCFNDGIYFLTIVESKNIFRKKFCKL
jgi:hypothetical protein